MVFGDSKSGKSTLLRHVIRTIRENSTPDRVAFTVIDRRLHLVDEPLFPDNEYTPNIDRITPAMLGLSALLEKRRPPAGLSPTTAERVELPVGWKRPHALSDHRRRRPDPRRPAVSGPFVGQRPWTGIIGLLRRPASSGCA